MKPNAKQVKEIVANIVQDKALCEEILSQPSSPMSGVQTRFQPSITPEELSEVVKTFDPSTAPPGITEAESIIIAYGRPVLLVKNNTFVSEPATFEDPKSEVWRDRLNQARSFLQAAIPAVGRIEVEESPTFDWLGTGWVVAEDIVVTNRHVASEFAQRAGEGFKFRRNFMGRTMEGIIDFREEFGVDEQSEFKLIDVLHIENMDGPDIAFFRVERTSGNLALVPPIRLTQEPPQQGRQVAVIGYPASDSRITDPALMRRIFGDVFNVKRLAPGEIMGFDINSLRHDCSTLGGNSGSVVLDLKTGEAVGLHFAGSLLRANFAVPANVIAERLSHFL